MGRKPSADELSLRSWMPPPMNFLHQQVTESSTFFSTSLVLQLFRLQCHTESLSDSFIHSLFISKELFLSPSLISKHWLLPCCVPITPCCHKVGPHLLIFPAGEGDGEWSSSGLIKMLMHLKGNISLPELRRLEKSALLNIRLFHHVKVALSPLRIARCSGTVFGTFFIPMQELLVVRDIGAPKLLSTLNHCK